MKGLIKFLLNTGVGREIVRAIFALAIRLFKRKILDNPRIDEYKRENVRELLEIADYELHADVEAGKINPKDLI